ncbi:MAG TPA: hypothetical protein VFB27_12510 [Opitutaceae bacterium]|nr:hypothetical protein [Opitutaceae bacterium]
MSGKEAKTLDDPAVILGVRSASSPPSHPEEEHRPYAILGGVSLAMPFLGGGTGWMVGAAMQPHDGSGAAWAPIGILWMLGLLAIFCLIGTVLSLFSLWKIERWPILAILGLAVNGGFLLDLLQMIFR